MGFYLNKVKIKKFICKRVINVINSIETTAMMTMMKASMALLLVAAWCMSAARASNSASYLLSSSISKNCATGNQVGNKIVMQIKEAAWGLQETNHDGEAFKWRCSKTDDRQNNKCHKNGIKSGGQYEFNHGNSGEHFLGYGTRTNRTQEASVHINVLIEELPLHQLASLIIGDLNAHFYNYDNYFPNVASYFNGVRGAVEKRRDEIAGYVLAKHATVAHMNGWKGTDYACSLLKHGFKKTPEPRTQQFHPLSHISNLVNEDKPTISQALEGASNMNKELVSHLTSIMKLAEKLGDGELSEFIGGDLLPPMQQFMKEVHSNIATVDQLTS